VEYPTVADAMIETCPASFSKPLQYFTTFETIRTMLIGYVRVSTNEQTLDLQKDALEKIGCIKTFSDVVSGAKAERKGLQEALEYVREGDTLVVWRLDRLGRSLKHLIETITKLNNRKIGFKSITENIDTTTSGGKLVFHIFGALAEFERDIIKDRTKAGLNAARARGWLGGRPKAKMLDNPKKVALAQSLYENRENTIDEICKTLNVSRATLYRYIKTRAT
jgi:DNA invertase Pin-like site-specific DNA recombinase